MALALFDRVQETTTTTGTGSVTLAGAVPGFQSFAVVGNGNTCYYTIVDGSAWEVGTGTYSTSGPTLARTTVLSNSNGNTSPITLAAGTKSVFLTYPAGKSVNLNESGNVSPLGTVSSGVWQGSTVGVAYGGTGVTASSGANSVVLRDSNQNIAVNRVNQSNTNTTAAGGTTALTAASSYIHTLVGTGGQTYTLPDATTLTTGVAFVFNNLATGTLTLANFAGTTIGTVPSGGAVAVFLTLNSTTGGTWDLHAYLPEGVTFGTNAFNLGTSIISGGTWQGGTIQTGYGGTGLTSYTSGGAVYANSSSTLTSGTLPLTAGGTAATTASGARTSLDVPSTTGSGASGTWGINITGNAATTSQTNFSNLTIGGSQVLSAANYTSYAPSLTGSGASGTWNINITGSAGSVSGYLPLSGGTMTGSLSFAQSANINFGSSTNEAGPWTISIIGSGGATPATKGTGFGRNLIVKAGNSDNGGGLAGGDLYLRAGAPTAPATSYGVVYLSDDGGFTQAGGSLRAPIFYDSDNTAYYVNPAGATSGSFAAFVGIGGNYGSDDGSWGARLNVGGTPHARLDVRAAGDGIITTMYSHNGQNRGFVGTMSNHRLALAVNGSEVQSVYSSYSESIGSYRAPIFYDSNNTAYYVDPASTSNLNGINVPAGSPGFVNAARGSYYGYSSGYGTIIYGVTSGSVTPCFNVDPIANPSGSFNGNGGEVMFRNGVQFISPNSSNNGYNNYFVLQDGYAAANNSFRAPIFYDSSNTGFYVDPAPGANGISANFQGRIQVGTFNNSQTNSGEAWLGRASDRSSGTFTVQLGGGSSSGRSFEVVDYAWSVVLGSINSDGSSFASGSYRAPIFYERDNTSFYLDPASTSVLNGLNLTSGVLSLSGVNVISRGATWTEFRDPSGATKFWLGNDASIYMNASNYYLRSNDSSATFVDINSSLLQHSSSLRAPIFYDSNDTGYYLNPNGSSLLYGIVLSGNMYFRPNSWIQCDTSAGIYWPNHYGAHFYPNGGSTYTQLQIDGSKNSYSGMYISHSAVNGMMYDSAGNGGVYREAQGRWYLYHSVGNNCMGVGTSATGSAYGIYVVKGGYFDGRVDGTIFYDANNTGYYLDPASTNSLRTVGDWRSDSSTWTGEFSGKMQYHANNWYLQFNSNMIFRRSDGTNVMTCDSGGNVTFTGNVTAYSDARLKENVVTIDSALAKVLKLRGVYYNKIGNPERRVGVIAQEIETVLPEVVRLVSDTNPSTEETQELLAVDYGNIAGLLIESTKEQNQEVVDLRNRVAQLESLIHKLIGD
jgi:hypothetical protein